MSQSKFIEKIKTDILGYFFSHKSCRFCENVEKNGTAGLATDEYIIWGRKDLICKVDN